MLMKAAETERFSPISRFSLQRGGDQVRIEITDINGSPCLWSERLFESLWSEKGGGLGIGLYLMRQLITETNGHLYSPRQLFLGSDLLTRI